MPDNKYQKCGPLYKTCEVVKRLKKALAEYGNHKPDCDYVQGLRGNATEKCSCGFEDKQ